MKNTIVYDLARIFVGPAFTTPRGIDRVDFLLARHFLRSNIIIFLEYCQLLGVLGFMTRVEWSEVYSAWKNYRPKIKDPIDDPRIRKSGQCIDGPKKK